MERRKFSIKEIDSPKNGCCVTYTIWQKRKSQWNYVSHKNHQLRAIHLPPLQYEQNWTHCGGKPFLSVIDPHLLVTLGRHFSLLQLKFTKGLKNVKGSVCKM